MYKQRKYTRLQKFLEMPNEIPPHDTFGRIFAAVEAGQFQKCFLEWIKTIAQKISGEVIAIDGKTVRRSFDKANEITVIPKLLSALEIQNCIITIDAMGR